MNIQAHLFLKHLLPTFLNHRYCLETFASFGWMDGRTDGRSRRCRSRVSEISTKNRPFSWWPETPLVFQQHVADLLPLPCVCALCKWFSKFSWKSRRLSEGKSFAGKSSMRHSPDQCSFEASSIQALEHCLDGQTTKYTLPRQRSHHIFTGVAKRR